MTFDLSCLGDVQGPLLRHHCSTVFSVVFESFAAFMGVERIHEGTKDAALWRSDAEGHRGGGAVVHFHHLGALHQQVDPILHLSDEPAGPLQEITDTINYVNVIIDSVTETCELITVISSTFLLLLLFACLAKSKYLQ